MDYCSTLYKALSQQCPEPAFQWLEDSIDSLESSSKPDERYPIISAMAKRKVGDEPFDLALQLGEIEGFEIHHWTLSDAARILMTLRLLKKTEKDITSLLSQVYSQGDERERAAMLMGLCLFDPNALWLNEAEDSCRTNSLVLLRAIALYNPYPSQHFSSRGFNQLVLKSLFLGLNIANIYGLSTRLNSELSQMCTDYIDERLAAGRDYPNSAWLAIRLVDCTADTYSLLADSLQAEETNRRYYASLSLLEQKDDLPEEIIGVIQHQNTIEENDQVRGLLSQLVK